MTAREASAPELYVERMARALADRCRFTVALADAPTMHAVAARLRRVARVMALPFDRTRAMYGSIRTLQALAEEHDAIHLISSHPASRWGILLAFALGSKRAPLICVEHRATPVDDIAVPRLLAPLLPALFRLSRRRAACTVAVSQASRDVLTNYYKLAPEHVRVVYNGVDLNEFAPDPAHPPTLRRELELRDTQPLVLILARLAANKGHRFLFDAAPAVLEQFPKLHIVCAGSPDEQTVLAQQVAALGLQQHVSFLGFRSDIANLLHSSDVFVLPSLAEGFARSIIEALAAGVPVVATRVGGAAEIITDGVNGLLVPPANPAALADALRRVLSLDAAAREQMQQAARASAQHFSVTRMAGEMLAIYQDASTAASNGADAA
jgi:glycosyltransferase involved in cell wall biosynthesis